MKKSIFFIGLSVLALFAFTLHSSDIKHSKTLAVVNSNSTMGDYASFNFPTGSVINEVNNSLQFTVPSGYSVIGSLPGGGFTAAASGGSVTCNCTSGSGGCSPAQAKGSYACVMTDCSTCNKSGGVSNSGSGGGSDYLDVDDIVIFNNAAFDFLSSSSELDGKIMLPSQFHNHPMIISKLYEIEANLLPSQNPSDTKIVFVNIYDYVVALEVPADIDNTSPNMAALGEGSSTSCSCNSGGSCPKGSKLIVTWCDATDCSSCTMSGIVNDPSDGSSHNFSIVKNRIAID